MTRIDSIAFAFIPRQAKSAHKICQDAPKVGGKINASTKLCSKFFQQVSRNSRHKSQQSWTNETKLPKV